jgi:hypothetical protein
MKTGWCLDSHPHSLWQITPCNRILLVKLVAASLVKKQITVQKKPEIALSYPKKATAWSTYSQVVFFYDPHYIFLPNMPSTSKGEVVPVLDYLNTTPWRRMGEWMYRSTFFLTSALVLGEWLAYRPCRFNPGERVPGTNWIGCWLDPRAGLDDVEKRKFLTLPGLELRLLGRPARNQSLYRLRHKFWLISFRLIPSCSVPPISPSLI